MTPHPPSGGSERDPRDPNKGECHDPRHDDRREHRPVLDVFSTAGAEKRAAHGCKGATVFRDPTEENRVWVVFDWDDAGWQTFVTDPEVPPVMKDAGHLGKPQSRSRSTARTEA